MKRKEENVELLTRKILATVRLAGIPRNSPSYQREYIRFYRKFDKALKTNYYTIVKSGREILEEASKLLKKIEQM